jgi:hypothetical protein
VKIDWSGPFTLSGTCDVRVRTPGSISCYWQCDLARGHAGQHEQHFDEGFGRWTDRDVELFSGRPSHGELPFLDRMWGVQPPATISDVPLHFVNVYVGDVPILQDERCTTIYQVAAFVHRHRLVEGHRVVVRPALDERERAEVDRYVEALSERRG